MRWTPPMSSMRPRWRLSPISDWSTRNIWAALWRKLPPPRRASSNRAAVRCATTARRRSPRSLLKCAGKKASLCTWQNGGLSSPWTTVYMVSDLPGGSRSICCRCWVSTSCVTPPWCWKPYWHCSDAAGIFQKGRSGKGLPVWNGQPVLRCWDSPLYSFWTVATILSALRLWRSCCRTTFLDRRSPC